MGAQSTYARPIILAADGTATFAAGAMLVFHVRIYYGQGSKFLRAHGAILERSAGGASHSSPSSAMNMNLPTATPLLPEGT